MKKAICPGTFDPITNGHIDIIRRAVATFGGVIVSVVKVPSKSTLFSYQERVLLVKEAVKNIKSPVIIVGAQDDPEHDTSSIKEIVELIPGARFRPVPFKNDTHSEAYAKIILEEISELT